MDVRTFFNDLYVLTFYFCLTWKIYGDTFYILKTSNFSQMPSSSQKTAQKILELEDLIVETSVERNYETTPLLSVKIRSERGLLATEFITDPKSLKRVTKLLDETIKDSRD